MNLFFIRKEGEENDGLGCFKRLTNVFLFYFYIIVAYGILEWLWN